MDRSGQLINIIAGVMASAALLICLLIGLIVLAQAGGFQWLTAAPQNVTPTVPPIPTSPPISATPGPPTATPDPMTPTVLPPVTLPPEDPNAAPLTLIDTLPAPGELPEVGLEVDLHYLERWARVEQTIMLRNNSGNRLADMVFGVPIAHQPGAFEFSGAEAEINRFVAPADASLDGIMLKVVLPRRVELGGLLRLTLRYRIAFQGVPVWEGFPNGNNGASGGVLRAGEWFPVIAPYDRFEGWQGWQYTPVGDPAIYPAANYTLAVRSEPQVKIAGGGFVQQEGDVWRFHIDQGRGMPFFASDQYAIAGSEWGSIPIHSYYLPGGEAQARNAITKASRALALYTDRFGDYAFPSLTIAQNGYRGDMEYSGMISLSDRTYVEGSDALLSLLIAHEMAHQWWYGGVGNDQVNQPWLDEGLASYTEIIYLEEFERGLADGRMATFEGRAQNGVMLDTPITGFSDTGEYTERLYARGAVFVRDLRVIMGDAEFFGFLKHYYQFYRGKIATTQDFLDLARQHTPQDLTPLYAQYFSSFK
jgi:hypothetical protein